MVLILILCIGLFSYFYVTKTYSGNEAVRIYIPRSATKEQINDTLSLRLGDYGQIVFGLWEILDGNTEVAHGSYVILPGEKAFKVANRIAKGRQTPVKVTVNVARTLNDLDNIIASNLELTSDDIAYSMDSVLRHNNEFKGKATYIASVVPDTYEMYWTESPSKAIEKLLYWRDKFWTDERISKARALGLSPIEVTTLASIVEEESNKVDEQPLIARLYLNRLEKGMKLQADPTVKYAIGDFSLKRLYARHLEVNSPYNTYKISGLPPGPIRLPQKNTIDAVLNAPKHNYIYMCAKEDFSGYHNFATDYNTHLQNAKRYINELNKRKIQ